MMPTWGYWGNIIAVQQKVSAHQSAILSEPVWVELLLLTENFMWGTKVLRGNLDIARFVSAEDAAAAGNAGVLRLTAVRLPL